MSVWYFAYGSNMQSATFAGRRGIPFRRALAARLRGWRLVLDKPPLVDVGESFANIVPDPETETFGVAYEIGPEDLAHVDLTEGVLIGNYTRIEVRIEPLDPLAAGPASAFTLVSERRAPEMRPSTRYMELLVEGALEHGLPQSYIAWLRTVPTNPPSARAREYAPLIEQALRRRS